MDETENTFSNNQTKILQAKLLILILLIPSTVMVTKASDQSTTSALAIGFGENERYVLYESGEVRKLLNNGSTIYVSQLNLTEADKESVIVDFEVYNLALYLYTYRSLSTSSGETAIKVYNLTSGEKELEKTYSFQVTQDNRVEGSLVLAASACDKGFAVLKANSTHSIIEVFKNEKGKFILTAMYIGRMTASIYRHGNTLLAATYRVDFRNDTPWVTPQITDLMDGNTLFELPALTPVVALTYTYIQVFNRNGSWECPVSVHNPTMNRMEYYIVYPEKQGLTDTWETIVSPYMDYLVVKEPSGSRITFKSGENITTTQILSIIPQGVYIPIDPKNGTLDVNPQNNTLLVKTIQGEKAKILYITKDSTQEIYSLNATFASKTEGFYAALTQDTAYIIDPENHKLVSISLLKQNETKPTNDQINALMLAFALAAIAGLVVITAILYHRRSKTAK